MPEAAPKKRSRFDQTEPEPRKNSRFDRRSRSPIDRRSESRRSRSPLGKDSKSPRSEHKASTSNNAAAMAAAAAAKINAQLQAKKGIQHVDVPPILSPLSSSNAPARSDDARPSSTGQSTSQIDGDIYIADGDYIKDVEINDLRNRYTLTKGSTQKMIKEETGADVTTRGSYYPDKAMATAANPPLYLHITSTTKVGLEKAISKIDDLMQQELPNLVDERRFRKREPEYERDELGRRKWPEAKIPVDMEPIPGFNPRAQVVGQGGQYVKHIQNETKCRVQIKGRGSGFLEHNTGEESDEPMYLHVASPDAEAVEKARGLCEDLLKSVRQNYEHFKANPPQRVESYTDGYGADANHRSYGGHGRGGRGRDNYSGSYDNNASHANNSYASPYSGAAATPAPGATESPAQQDYAAQYAQYYANQPGGDPYAAYGGYQAYMQAYYQYYQQQQAQQAPQDGSAPPPPPPDNSGSGAPPPPPSDTMGYNAVPPPPGM